MKKLRIAIDMDDVMANTSKKLLQLHQTLFGSNWQPEDFKGLGFQELIKVEEYQVVRDKIFDVGFFADLEVLPNAVEVISYLHEHHEVFIVSAAMEFPNSLSEKQTWLGIHFPFIHWKNIVFCGDKSIITADVLIDDHEKNLVTFQGIPLLFDAIHNQTLGGYQRVHTWLEVKAVIDDLAHES